MWRQPRYRVSQPRRNGVVNVPLLLQRGWFAVQPLIGELVEVEEVEVGIDDAHGLIPVGEVARRTSCMRRSSSSMMAVDCALVDVKLGDERP